VVLTEFETTTGWHRREKAGPLPYTVPEAGIKFPASHQILSQWWLGRLLGCVRGHYLVLHCTWSLKLCSLDASSLGSDKYHRTRGPNNLAALKSRDFVADKSEVPFTALFTDQALEQEIKDLERHGGIVGLSQVDSGLDRLVTIGPQLTRMVKQYLIGFPRFC